MDLQSDAIGESDNIVEIKQPILSLCIPTYNRKEKLARLVNGVLENIDKAAGKIEICISDNASTDGTGEFLNEFISNKHIKILKHSVNKGFDHNYVSVFAMATGKYVWIMGDDDTIMDNGLEKMLHLLQIESPDYVYVHIASSDNDLPKYFPEIKPGNYDPKILQSMLCKDGLDMFGFIGSHIFKKNALAALSSDDEKVYMGWPHVAILLSASDNFKSFLVTEPLARQIGDGLVWTATNWVLVSVKKIDILAHYTPKWAYTKFKNFWIIKNTFLNKSSISNVIHAKILEPARYAEIIDKTRYYYKKSKGTLRFVIYAYLNIILIIKNLPIDFLLSKFKSEYYKNKVKEYSDLQIENASNEGYSRENADQQNVNFKK